jgi:hypothetical protein
MQREKGKRFEREVARAFREALPGTDPHRGQQARDGADAPDVVGVPAFWIEAKHRGVLAPEAALRQAQAANSEPSCWPVAVLKRNRGEAFVCMDLGDFLELVGAWWRETRPEPAAHHEIRSTLKPIPAGDAQAEASGCAAGGDA